MQVIIIHRSVPVKVIEFQRYLVWCITKKELLVVNSHHRDWKNLSPGRRGVMQQAPRQAVDDGDSIAFCKRQTGPL